jgi:signal transduction histidine kinase/ActR/RegA family two-component response regulator
MNFPNLKTIRILTFVFLASAILLVLALFRSNRLFIESEKQIRHTQDMIYLSGKILIMGFEIETATRSYVLSEHSIPPEHLLSSRNNVFNEIEQLRKEVSDKPEQIARADSLSYYMLRWLECTKNIVEIETRQGLSGAIQYSVSAQCNTYSIRLQKITQEILETEQILLLQREAKSKFSAMVYKGFSIFILVLMIVSTFLLRIAVLKYLHQSGEREKRAAELLLANTELRYQNEEKEKRASELLIANNELIFQSHEKEKRALELTAAMAKAEESDRLKSAFLSILSHEIRTPMNQILGFASLLEDSQLSPDDRGEFLTIINNQSYQLLHIIADIVEMSKLTAGQVKLDITAFDPEQMMKVVLNDNTTKAGNRNLKLLLKETKDHKTGRIMGDEAKLKNILNILIDNAIKYTDEGSVQIGYHTMNDRLIFEVEDTGIGISKQEQHVIFNYFRQIETSISERYSGLGLGLAISAGYANMMSGDINVVSLPGKGSTFQLDIPYVPCEALFQDNNLPEAGILHQIQQSPKWQQHTILIVDDDEPTIKFYKVMLRQSGIHALFAYNGVDAVKQCREHSEIDIVLMDIKMPRMDGLEATQQIKAFRDQLPIIATTAFANTGDKQHILEAGCDDYLPKPIKGNELIAMIGKYLTGLGLES